MKSDEEEAFMESEGAKAQAEQREKWSEDALERHTEPDDNGFYAIESTPPEEGASETRRRGRPTIEESTGDQNIGQKARDLREAGLSWTQIADTLKIGRSTARRLCKNSGHEQDRAYARQGVSDFRHRLRWKKDTSGEA